MNRNRVMSLIVSAVILVIVVVFNSYNVVHAHHECIGDDCPICAEMQNYDQILKHFSANPDAASELSLSLCFKTFSQFKENVCETTDISCTPVSLKNRQDK